MITFKDLPLEIILLIVDHVDPRDMYPWTLVNKQFYAKANPVLWREPEIRSNTNLRQFSTFLLRSPQLARNVRSIDLVDFHPYHVDIMNLMYLVPFLEELYIQRAGYIVNMNLILQHCPLLTYLSLEQVRLTQLFINNLALSCRRLRQLVLLDCWGLTCRVFASLATLSFLEELAISIGHIDRFDHEFVNGDRQHWAEERALELAQLHRLTKLTLHYPPPQVVRCITTTTTDRAGNPAWPHLAHLYLEHCDDLDDSPITGFIESHRLLQTIVLVQGKFTDATLVTISKCLSGVLTRLAVLNNRQITNGGIRRLICACPLLESVRLLGCGIRQYHFPEAGDHCLDDSFMKIYIDHLDWDTIYLIQKRGDRSLIDFSDSSDGDVEDDNSSTGENDDDDFIDKDD